MADREAPLGIVGNLNVDLVLGPVERLPAWDEELLASTGNMWVAGTAGYMALTAYGLGIEPRIVSTLGSDHLGEVLLTELADRAIPADGITVLAGEATPVTVVTVGPAGRRGIVSVLGAHARMDLDQYLAHRTFLAGCPEVVICGTYLLPGFGPQAAIEVARDAHSRGQLVAFDPSWDPSGWSADRCNAIWELLAHVDLYLPNEQELLHLTGESTWEEGLRAVSAVCGEVVVKRGEQGAAASVRGACVKAQGLAVSAVNSIGAGDAFDVGYLWARRQGWPPVKRLVFANALAGIVVSTHDRSRFPDRHAVLARLGAEVPTPNMM